MIKCGFGVSKRLGRKPWNFGESASLGGIEYNDSDAARAKPIERGPPHMKRSRPRILPSRDRRFVDENSFAAESSAARLVWIPRREPRHVNRLTFLVADNERQRRFIDFRQRVRRRQFPYFVCALIVRNAPSLEP
jgi:hypothetical protein